MFKTQAPYIYKTFTLYRNVYSSVTSGVAVLAKPFRTLFMQSEVNKVSLVVSHHSHRTEQSQYNGSAVVVTQAVAVVQVLLIHASLSRSMSHIPAYACLCLTMRQDRQSCSERIISVLDLSDLCLITCFNRLVNFIQENSLNCL